MRTGIFQIDDGDSEWIVGSDEAGYGSWAGQLVVAAAAVPRGWSDPRLKDSKKYSGPKQKEGRLELFREFVKKKPHIVEVVFVEPEEIDSMGPGPALRYGHQMALKAVCDQVKGSKVVVVDGSMDMRFPGAIYLPKADNLVPACSLASIYAKSSQVLRMRKAAKEYPGYGFESHCGYGTTHHRMALAKLGPSAIHRRSYAPIAELIAKTQDGEEPREAWMMFDDD